MLLLNTKVVHHLDIGCLESLLGGLLLKLADAAHLLEPLLLLLVLLPELLLILKLLVVVIVLLGSKER